MPAFFLPLVACAIASIGARDQMLVARLAAATGQGRSLLTLIFLSCAFSAALAAWFGDLVSGMLPRDAKRALVAIAMLLAALELAWPWRNDEIREPTRSMGATLLVLGAQQLTDAARFLIFALAAALPSPALVAAGGFLGSSAVLAWAWSDPQWFARRRLMRRVRQGVAAILFLLAVVMGLMARRLIG